ncbi:MAG: sulfate ABC transporter substrate-binding protein [Oligoflexia bacterium]|nr:sulfate ABC transporter substrate-binding protein [Oligoflexia bacterium]
MLSTQNSTLSRFSFYFYLYFSILILSISTFSTLYVKYANADLITILNVSYDPTREFYKEFNTQFEKYWEENQKKKGINQKVVINQSHGGSGVQARAIMSGLEADVATLALAYDIDAINSDAINSKSQSQSQPKLLDSNWQKRLPYNSCPYTSTIIFLVRKGNPKNIRDWDDLIKNNVEVIMPNPKTSGAARWNYLAAWGYALNYKLAKLGGDLTKISQPQFAPQVLEAEKYAKTFITSLYKQVSVLDTGARGSTTTFINRNIGDVLVTWENEVLLAFYNLNSDKSDKSGKSDKFEIVIPSISISAEPPVAVIDKVVDKRGTRAVAEAYLKYLYSPTGQTLAAKHFYRPINNDYVTEKKYLQKFSKIKLFSLNDVFGDWNKAHKIHFADKGIFDQIYQPQKK